MHGGRLEQRKTNFSGAPRAMAPTTL
jgi:hypothetical protein